MNISINSLAISIFLSHKTIKPSSVKGDKLSPKISPIRLTIDFPSLQFTSLRFVINTHVHVVKKLEDFDVQTAIKFQSSLP